MEILFTKSNYPASKLIMGVTGEPVSHCAIRYSNFVLHSNFTGFNITNLGEFQKHSTIVLRAEAGHPGVCSTILELLNRNLGKGYDWKAFFWLGIRLLAKKLGLPFWKVPLKEIAGLNICTEFVASVVLRDTTELLTPYQLYQKLQKKV